MGLCCACQCAVQCCSTGTNRTAHPQCNGRDWTRVRANPQCKECPEDTNRYLVPVIIGSVSVLMLVLYFGAYRTYTVTYETQLVAVCLWIVQFACRNAVHVIWQWFLSTRFVALLKRAHGCIAHVRFKLQGGSVGESLEIPPFEGLSKVFVTYVISSWA